MKKKKSYAFGKDIYLLGKDENGTQYWLEAPSWDCGWYWGFGYVKTYTNNRRPDLSAHIASHQHIDSSFIGRVGDEYIYNIFETPLLKGGTTFTEEEGWELSELFSQFYTLKKSAEFFYLGKSNTAPTTVKHDREKNKEIFEYINQTLMPPIFERIKEILTPSEC